MCRSARRAKKRTARPPRAATLYLQDLRGWSALETAAAFWPCGALLLAVATAVNLARTNNDGTPQDMLHSYHMALLVPLTAAAASLVLTVASIARNRSAATALADAA